MPSSTRTYLPNRILPLYRSHDIAMAMPRQRPTISRPILASASTISSRQKLSSWQLFRQSPSAYLVEQLYICRKIPRHAASPSKPIRIVCISDTHDLRPELPDGDVLLHAGDLTSQGTFDQLQTQLNWLNKQTHRYKVVIAGNRCLDLDPSIIPNLSWPPR